MTEPNGEAEGAQDQDTRLSAMEAKLTQFTTGLQNLEKLTTQMFERLPNPDDAPASGGPSQSAPAPDLASLNLEGMTNTEFAAAILKTMAHHVEQSLKEKLEPLESRLSNTSTAVSRDMLQKQLKDLQSGDKTKDVLEWQHEMKDLAKEFPNATLQDLYQLARNRDTDKAMEMDKKYNTVKEEPPQPSLQDQLFGGMSPAGSPPTTSGKTDKSFDDAAEDAWNQTFGSASQVAQEG